MNDGIPEWARERMHAEDQMGDMPRMWIQCGMLRAGIDNAPGMQDK